MEFSEIEEKLMNRGWKWWILVVLAFSSLMVGAGIALQSLGLGTNFLVESGVVIFTVTFSIALTVERIIPEFIED